MLWDEYEWEHLILSHTESFVNLQAGQNIYNFPANSDLATITKVWASNGDVWLPVESGIDLSDYSEIDPTENNRSDPVQRWEARSLDTFEVFPLPASNNERIGFDSRKKFTRLVNQSDLAQIDSLSIVLLCASELLANSSAKDASLKLKMAQDRINKMKARTTTSRRFGFSKDGSNNQKPRELRVAYVRN